MNANLQDNDRHIFTESIHGASVGVKIKDKDVVHFKFSGFPSYVDPGEYRRVANLEMFKDVEEEITVRLRVYYTKDEAEKAQKDELNIYVGKKGKFEIKNLNKQTEEFSEERHPIWAGYIEIDMQVGDPPIAVG